MPTSPVPLRIAIDARPFSGPPCGYTVYLASVIRCLRAEDIQLTLLSNQPLQPRYADVAGLDVRIFGEKGALRWEQASLPQQLHQERYDLYFAGANRGIPIRKCRATHYVLGLLDIIPYLYWRHYLLKPLRRRSSRGWVAKETVSQLIALARADSIVTISGQSAADIKRLFRRTAIALPIRLPQHEISSAGGTGLHFAYIGGVDYRKRVDVLLQAFAAFSSRHPGYRLYLIGNNYASVTLLIEQLGLAEQVIVTGFIDNEAKYSLLGSSVALVYPSLYEGYGLAIAEGFQAGTAVIAGLGGSQAEIGGGAVRVIDPTSPSAIAEAMEEMLDGATRRSWVERGRSQLPRLTDPAIERDTQAFFRERALRARRGGLRD